MSRIKVQERVVIQAGLRPISMRLWGADRPAFARALMGSFEEFGFAVVGTPDLDQAVVEDATAAAKAFFALPDADKRRWHTPGQAGQRGYTPFGIETAKGAERPDLKEFWHMGRDLPSGHPYRQVMLDNVWPDAPAGFHPAIERIYRALDGLGRELLEATAMGLDLPAPWFEDKTALGDSILRLAHYPPVSPDAVGVRAGAHEDINVITLLLGAEEAGLEILTRAGRWLAVNPEPGALVVNVGDMLQRLTNHRLPSTTHRVVNPPPERRGMARLSTPFFLHFQPDFLIETLPSCVDEAHPDLYPEPITAYDYLQQRLREIGLRKTAA
jgi:isopenicillin N synthase-like dioxygenase